MISPNNGNGKEDKTGKLGRDDSERVRHPHEITPAQKDQFLEYLMECGIVCESATKAGVNRKTLYGHRDRHPEFKADWDRAKRIGIEACEDELIRRGYHGDDKNVYNAAGFVQEVVKVKDTSALKMVVGAYKSDIYGQKIEQKVAITSEVRFAGQDRTQVLAAVVAQIEEQTGGKFIMPGGVVDGSVITKTDSGDAAGGNGSS